jgi:hypothetical protein
VSVLAYLDERRGSSRKSLRLTASAPGASGDLTQVVVHEISETGLLLEGTLTLTQGEELEVVLPRQGARRVNVAWFSGRFFGCQFAEPLPPPGSGAAIASGTDALPKKGSQEAVSLAAVQLRQLSMAIERISRVLDRAIEQLSERNR